MDYIDGGTVIPQNEFEAILAADYPTNLSSGNFSAGAINPLAQNTFDLLRLGISRFADYKTNVAMKPENTQPIFIASGGAYGGAYGAGGGINATWLLVGGAILLAVFALKD